MSALVNLIIFFFQEAFLNLPMIVENEIDWPMTSAITGQYNNDNALHAVSQHVHIYIIFCPFNIMIVIAFAHPLTQNIIF